MNDANPRNKKFDKEKYLDELAERLTKMSDEILSYDPQLVVLDRQDLMYMEDNNLLWRASSIKQLPEFEMSQLLNLIKKKHEYAKFNPGANRLDI